MSERKLFVCTNCHEFWSSAKEAVTCPGCGSPVCPVDQSYSEYAAWTAEEKAAFKTRYVAEHDLAAEAARLTKTETPFRERADQIAGAVEDDQFWINSLNTALNIALILFVLVAVILFFVMALQGGEGVLVGLLTAVVIVVAGFLSVAGMKIFIGMAKDLKAIRKKMDA